MQVFVVFTQRIMWNDGINAVSLRGGRGKQVKHVGKYVKSLVYD